MKHFWNTMDPRLVIGTVISFLIVMIVLSGCKKQTIDVESHKQEIQQWKDKRLTRLKSDTGWLTLCGLFWLKEGENTFGTDSSNAIIFPPGKAPKVAGSIWVDQGNLRMQSRPGVEIRVNDSLVSALPLLSDGEGSSDPTVLSLGSLNFYVIKRGDQLAVRVKDKESPARVHFKGLEYFPVDPKWHVDATFEPYTPPKILPIATMINTVENDTCPGALVFEIDGKEFRLDVVMEVGTTDQFFIMFSDETSGKETYGMGRQLYTSLPDKDNHVTLDFNKAYNWPCVFTVFATCPIPPRQNHLPIRVEAGEKMYTAASH